ncbi:MAG: DUF262 domain-containing protein [Caldilineaceae bacterium]
MTDQTITLKTVAELRVDPQTNGPRKFHIPAYQRGYRWAPLQVTQLLDDIRDFTQRRNPQPDEFYCLQPLVIKLCQDRVLEVVDGQQRLTTILLILRYFNERLAEKYRQPVFKLAYATRSTLDIFLAAPSTELAEGNVDFFHLHQAIAAIDDWFGGHNTLVNDIESTLLNRTKVIWYELAESDKPVDAFTRLNVGKIPLTNDELIRALFLRRTGPDEKDAASAQMRIAYEWDQFEKALQADAFWYFLSNQPQVGQNRIGFVFDLVARAGGMHSSLANDAYGLFYFFNDRLKAKGASPEDEWDKVKQTHAMLEEWFEDRTLYHMVGFLVSQRMHINEIRKLSMDCAKSIFEQRLRGEIYKRVIGKQMPADPNARDIGEDVSDRLAGLTYGSKQELIRSVLLLFNLATLLQNGRSNMRFQFDSFKSESWDIEHIRSVGDDKPERHDTRRKWLENSLGYLRSQADGSELCEEIESFLRLSAAEATNDKFDPLYERVLQYFHEDSASEVEQGRLGNLTLLDDHTNRSYKNAVFAVKRQRLLNLDRAGIFVPLCTRNAFLKCYSPQVDNAMFWSENDQQGYVNAITSTLVDFFCGKQDGIE